MKSTLRRRFIVDTDVGFDDIVALRALVLHLGGESQHEDVLLSTVHGISETSVGAPILQRSFPHLTVVQSPLNVPQAHVEVPSWLKEYRSDLDNLLTTFPTTSINAIPIEKSFEPLYSFLGNTSKEAGVVVLCIGPLSNLAEWHKQHEDLLEEKVHEVWILGGNDPRSADPTPEFNLSQDAAASHYVFRSALASKVRLVLASDTSPDNQGHLVDQIQDFAAGKRGMLARILQVRPQECCFDPLAAFATIQVASAGRHEQIPMSVNPNTGLLTFGNGQLVGLVQDLRVETGFLPWLQKAIELDDANAV
ncbi:Psort location Cytoplasmic [Fragilaria crotonensis]|nr:Psort location Cytoplasmic [Fragilaria crotonensis]